ncbi:MAG TPA: hypothetical protein VMT90_09455 [Dehalococcoidia bacterium]|nr:hypothetical protein [Dehalococcoidia bacterium]
MDWYSDEQFVSERIRELRTSARSSLQKAVEMAKENKPRERQDVLPDIGPFIWVAR